MYVVYTERKLNTTECDVGIEGCPKSEPGDQPTPLSPEIMRINMLIDAKVQELQKLHTLLRRTEALEQGNIDGASLPYTLDGWFGTGDFPDDEWLTKHQRTI